MSRGEMEMADEPKKEDTVVGTVMKNGGGAATGALVGTAVVAPLAIWGLGVILTPFTGGLSLAAAVTAGAVVGTAVVGHKASKKID
jgi:Mg/Co/Ni transporter MgtE